MSDNCLSLCIQDSSLGYLGVLDGPAGVVRITFGHRSATAARNSLTKHLTNQSAAYPETDEVLETSASDHPLLARLADFAEGAPDEFLDVQLDFTGISAFQQRVLERCRRISYGTTASYGELAERVGHAGAARAVGSTMAANRWPLVVPCHRVVQAGGQLGNYSAPQGVRMKRRLLEMESAGVLV